MTGQTPERGRQAEAAASLRFEEWMTAMGYTRTGVEYDADQMAGAFAAGMLAQRGLDAQGPRSLTGCVDVHFVGDGPHPLQVVCLTEDDRDVECMTEIAEVKPGGTWGEVEELISAHARRHHVPAVTVVTGPAL